LEYIFDIEIFDKSDGFLMMNWGLFLAVMKNDDIPFLPILKAETPGTKLQNTIDQESVGHFYSCLDEISLHRPDSQCYSELVIERIEAMYI
jgi:hypothetical protein